METLLSKYSSLDSMQIVTDSKTLPPYFAALEKQLHWTPIKSSGLMHAKILSIDDTTVFLGTANMTYESLTMHDNIVLGIYHPPLATYLREYTHELVHNKRLKNNAHTSFDLHGQLLELWLLPYLGDAPLNKLKNMLQNATSSIDIAMFTLTHPTLLEELTKAHHRGVNVRVFLDHTSASGASAPALALLKHENIPIYLSTGVQLLHHKLMLVDGESFVLGSTNWTKAAFKKNYDFYIVLSHLTGNQRKQLQTMFARIARESTNG